MASENIEYDPGKQKSEQEEPLGYQIEKSIEIYRGSRTRETKNERKIFYFHNQMWMDLSSQT